MSIQQRLIVVFLDILVLTELAGCLFWANQNPQDFTTTFLYSYLPMAFGTLVLGKLWIRKVQSRQGDEACPQPAV
ncbi:hypothetical protein [Desulfococcus sp.]|uniref:hypothetical protein n=1 Tax=Desulfococcus sp. TaxID=2025834 RepID=UPI00359422A7